MAKRRYDDAGDIGRKPELPPRMPKRKVHKRRSKRRHTYSGRG